MLSYEGLKQSVNVRENKVVKWLKHIKLTETCGAFRIKASYCANNVVESKRLER